MSDTLHGNKTKHNNLAYPVGSATKDVIATNKRSNANSLLLFLEYPSEVAAFTLVSLVQLH